MVIIDPSYSIKYGLICDGLKKNGFVHCAIKCEKNMRRLNKGMEDH